MLNGKTIILRPVRDTDIDLLYTYHTDINNRGAFFPRGIVAQPTFRNRFQEDGFWGKDDGMLVMVSPAGEILGHIEFFKTVNYLDEYELSYQVYASESWGKGLSVSYTHLDVYKRQSNHYAKQCRSTTWPPISAPACLPSATSSINSSSPAATRAPTCPPRSCAAT